MLVKDVMTRHPIMISAETSAAEAQRMMSLNGIRHLPVVGNGKRLVGMVTNESLRMSPETLGSLNVWEITRYLSNLQAKQVMIGNSELINVTEDQTVERVAASFGGSKASGAPVVDRDGAVVGVITEVDLLAALQTMLGLPAEGIRATVRMPDRKGEFAKLMNALANAGLGVMGIGTYPSPRREGFYDAVIKVAGGDAVKVRTALLDIEDQEIVDIRTVA